MSKFTSVISDNLDKSSCVVLVGPELSLNKGGIPLQRDLLRHVTEEASLNIDTDVEGFVVYKDNFSEISYYNELLNYHQDNSSPSDFLKKLASLPGHLFITINPDHQLRNAFRDQELAYSFAIYNKNEVNNEINDRPSTDQPLIYHLFGDIEHENSLINTSKDLFDYLFSLFSGEQRLPRNLLSAVKRSRFFLFLGFDFNKWYLKLLLRLLNEQGAAIPLVCEPEVGVSVDRKSFLIDNFKMQFVDVDVPELINALHNEFEKRGRLRQAGEGNASKKSDPSSEREGQSLLEMLETADVGDVLDTMKDFVNQKLETVSDIDIIEELSELLKKVIFNISRWRDLKGDLNDGIIDRDEGNKERNKIRKALIDLAGKLDNHR